MSLPPGTRIPSPEDDELEDMTTPELMVTLQGRVLDAMSDHWWRDRFICLLAGGLAGSILTACALALAWAHMGG